MTGRSFYLWQVPSFAVRTAFDAIDRLNRCLADPRINACEEQGGILYGVLRGGVPEITNFEFFRSEHRRGIAYDLGARERARVARLVSARMRSRGEKPLGYFRTHLRPGLFLDQDDFSLMKESFPDPKAVALLIRPGVGADRTAGFFYWEGDDIDRRQTQHVFPFDSTLLTRDTSIPAPAAASPAWQISLPSIKWAAAALVVPAIAAVVALHHPSTPEPRNALAAPTVVIAPPAVRNLPLPPKLTPEPEITEPSEPVEGARQTAPAAVFSDPLPHLPSPRPLPVPPPPEQKPVEVAKVFTPPVVEVVREEPRRERSVLVAISMEPRMLSSGKASEIRRVVGRVPLFGHPFRPKEEAFTPAHPERTLAPHVPGRLADDLSHEFPVDVRLSIDRTGAVTSAEVLNGGGTTFANLAADRASATAWRPALLGDRQVPSEMILHYRFRAAQ